MSFFITPTASDFRSLIQEIREDYQRTLSVLNNVNGHPQLLKLFKSSLWVKFPSNATKPTGYTVYTHKLTGCHVKVFERQDNPALDQIRRKVGEHIERFLLLRLDRLNNNAINFLSKRTVSGRTNLMELNSKIPYVYNNAISIIRFLLSIGYKHGGEGNQSNAENKKGYKPEQIKSLLPAEVWQEEKPSSGHFSRKSTFLQDVRIGGSNHTSDVSEGELIDVARRIQDYVNRLAIDIFKLPCGYIEKLEDLERKVKNPEILKTMEAWYKNLPLLAITQYVAFNVEG